MTGGGLKYKARGGLLALVAVVVAVTTLASSAQAYVVPGSFPVDYTLGDELEGKDKTKLATKRRTKTKQNKAKGWF